LSNTFFTHSLQDYEYPVICGRMHPTQKAILDLARMKNLVSMSLKEIAGCIGEDPVPQKIKYHIDCLVKNGFLKVDREAGVAEVVAAGGKQGVVSLPLVGAASAGPATVFADENVEAYLQVSSSFLPRRGGDFFVIRVVGNSMNNADVNGQCIGNGDFVVVDGRDRVPQDGKYYVSIIGDVANIKKVRLDKRNGVIALVSESKTPDEFPPIFIDLTNGDSFSIAGKVVRVLKNPS
jgi:SOS-response transcriptional repressor LexA